MSNLIANTLLMIEPVGFGFNESAAETNSFQQRMDKLKPKEIQQHALKEFNAYVELLRSNGIDVMVYKDLLEPFTPDSIFPNNWFSTDPFDKTLYTYPMANENRADERREDIIKDLIDKRQYVLNQDLLAYEPKKQYLEGTGSMVLDHQNKLAYACLSPRTDHEVLRDWCKKSDYEPIGFYAYGDDGSEVYHTNVAMTMADEYAIICLESILDDEQRDRVIDSLVKRSRRSIIDITMEQMNLFAGNMLQVQNKKGDKFLIMSNTAKNSLSEEQKTMIVSSFNNTILAPKIEVIETIGGGSARCMIAEIF